MTTNKQLDLIVYEEVGEDRDDHPLVAHVDAQVVYGPALIEKIEKALSQVRETLFVQNPDDDGNRPLCPAPRS